MSRKKHILIPWFGIFLLPGFLLIWQGPAIHDGFADPADWYHIAVPPHVHLDESGAWEVCITTEIRRNFTSQWKTTVRQIQGDGNETPVRGGSFQLPFEQDYNLKAESEFCLGWEDYTGLALPEESGIYRLYVTWPMETADGRVREQRAASNQFEIEGDY